MIPPPEVTSLDRTLTRMLFENGVRGPPIAFLSRVYWAVSVSAAAMLTTTPREHSGGNKSKPSQYKRTWYVTMHSFTAEGLAHAWEFRLSAGMSRSPKIFDGDVC